MSTTSNSMLVHLAFHAGAQSGQDEETTAEICSAKNATDDGLKANVRYICKEAYEPITKLKNEFTKKIKRITTPYEIKSVYLAKSSAVAKIIALRDEYMPAFQMLKTGHLLGRYDEWLELTKAQTGDAFKPERFPTKDQLDSSCRWELSVMPIPESELLRKVRDLDEHLIDELVKSQEERVQSMFAKAKAEGYARMIAPLQKMVEVLTKDEPKIFESLVGNVSDIVEAIGDINHDNDPTLNEFAAKAGEMLKNINLKELRKDPVIRKETAEQAQAMLTMFGNLSRKFAA